ncbi:hypothetical protein GCK72_012862 [Caenorhabditis remanei]|uniref:Uncharacterized protein n=1 Tax=Caenorhabditis remanei TaxID=31234 RepID=A0A6A5GPL4_CAERE|nr:hypothetical protein GCK72_012862 [Caenorhabditis remanei]KAF1756409.1 hypothetical protein GCK72_012862 [Caenorhabditis remanei]
MECVNCECTVKTMDNLENAIQHLLRKGNYVSRMMKDEKLIRDAKKMEEVEQLKKQLPKVSDRKVTICTTGSVTMDTTMTNSKPGRRIYNKKLGVAESIDFDVPSLPSEMSETLLETSNCAYSSASLPPKGASSTCTKSEVTTITTEMTQSTFTKAKKKKNGGGAVVLDSQYKVDKDGNVEALPMKIYIKQRAEDNSLDLYLVFFDEKNEKVMDVSMIWHEKNIRDVQFCGKEAKLIG